MADPSKATAELQRRPDPNENLVKIFDTEQESEAMVVNGLLESAGIDCDMTALSAPQDTFPGVGGTIILVREEDAARAKQLIAEFQQSPAASDDECSGETAEGDTASGISGHRDRMSRRSSRRCNRLALMNPPAASELPFWHWPNEPGHRTSFTMHSR
jgi:hypothetical protein